MGEGVEVRQIIVYLGNKLFMLSFWQNGKCGLESGAVRRRSPPGQHSPEMILCKSVQAEIRESLRVGRRSQASALPVSLKHLDGAVGGLLCVCQWPQLVKTRHFQEPQQMEQGTETDTMELKRENQNNLHLCAKGQLHRLTSSWPDFFLSPVVFKKCISRG